MKKNIVQDVIPPKKSIRNIKLPTRSGLASEVEESKNDISPKKVAKKSDNSRPIKIMDEAPMRIELPPTPVSKSQTIVDTPSYKYEYDEPVKSKKKWFYISVGALVVILAFGLSAFFKSAKITVTPEQQTKVLSNNFTAQKDVSSSGLSFQIVSITKDVEKTVMATGQEQVEKKATGTIVIYNNYNSSSQKLVATTRFETPEGLIFRLINPVTVPGKQTVNGKSVAGSVEAVVEADKVGPAYNIGLKDFTIPGFKGDPKYSSVYGRSKTEMTGGFSGMQQVVSKEATTQADTELTASLKDSLSKNITSQIPVDFLLYPQSLSYNLDPVTQVADQSSSSGNVVIRKKGTASGIIFDKASLTKAILNQVLPNAGNDTIKVSNLADLVFSLQNGISFDMNNSNSLAFNLKGPANLVWVFDENKLKSDLLGLSKKNAMTVIGTYGMIKEAWVETHPFWSQTVPNDPNKVTVVNTLQ